MRHLRIYRAIQMIHRSGSIRRAAQDLAISPSALNRSVQAFEDELSFKLFERTAGGVRLSEAGELLLNVIETHLIEFHELQRQLGRLRDGETGALRISVGSDLLAGALTEVLDTMETAHPGISIDVWVDDGIDGLRSRKSHLALLTNPATDDAVEVVHAQSVNVVAWHNGKDDPVPNDLLDLSERRILLPPEGTGTSTALSHLFRRRRLKLTKTSSLPAAQAKDYVGSNGRIAIFPEIALPGTTLPKHVTRLPLDFGTVQFCVLRAAQVPMARPAQIFLTLLQLRLVEESVE